MLLAYDFEVFKHNWLMVALDLITGQEYEIVDDREALAEFYEAHKNYIWAGFNSRNYDVYILKSIIRGYNPYEISKAIVEDERKGWQLDSSFADMQLFSYDVRPSNISPGLKTYEAFMGHDIRETEVPFDIDRKLTEEEIKKSIFYCRHDVKETAILFCKMKEEWDAVFSLIKEFDLPLSCISKTKAQLTAVVLNCVKQDRDDEWDFDEEPCIRISKYKAERQWYKDNRTLDGKPKLETDLAGCPSILSWGGLHGAKSNYFGEGKFLNIDVGSYYPTLMIEWNMLSRNSTTPWKFKEIYDKRMKLKREGKKKEQAPLKIALNGTYGASGDKFNDLYDPRQAHRVCSTGQLMFIDLIEKIEDFVEIVQINTDGILVKYDTDEQERKFKEACEEWSQRTRMSLEFDEYVKIFQKDVNNYIAVPSGDLYNSKGKPRWKCKGAFVKQLSELDYDLAIVNRAVVDYFIKGNYPEKTVMECDELIDFQKIFKVSSLYKEALQGCTFREEKVVDDNGKKKVVNTWNGDGTLLTDKTYRVFATTDTTGALYKHKEGKNPEKFASCPDNCRIVNENIVGWKCSQNPWLDKQWYIDLAWERINQFKKRKSSKKSA